MLVKRSIPTDGKGDRRRDGPSGIGAGGRSVDIQGGDSLIPNQGQMRPNSHRSRSAAPESYRSVDDSIVGSTLIQTPAIAAETIVGQDRAAVGRGRRIDPA